MHLSQSTQYALVALRQLKFDHAAPPIPCSTLCKLGSMPERFLLQVLRKLTQAGVIVSTRGVNGGYRLAKLPQLITLADVVTACDGPIMAKEPIALAPLNGSKKRVAKVLASIAADTRKQLAGVTLATL